jgi:hypothetical protein
VVGERFDVEEECSWNVVFEVAGVGVDGWRDADGRECGVEDDRSGILQAASQPGGGDERVHED